MATTEPVAGSDASGTLSALLHEERRYPPSDEFKKNALWNDPAIYERAEQDPEAFWAEQAQAILNAQASRAARLKVADDVITNDADMSAVQNQVAALHARYLELSAQPRG